MLFVLFISAFIIAGCQAKGTNEEKNNSLNETEEERIKGIEEMKKGDGHIEASIVAYDFNKGVKEADAIVSITIDSMVEEEDGPPMTILSGTINAVLKGDPELTGKSTLVQQFGKQKDTVKGNPRLAIGNTYILFLNGDEQPYYLL